MDRAASRPGSAPSFEPANDFAPRARPGCGPAPHRRARATDWDRRAFQSQERGLARVRPTESRSELRRQMWSLLNFAPLYGECLGTVSQIPTFQPRSIEAAASFAGPGPALVCRSCRQMFSRLSRANSTQASSGECDTSAIQLARSGKAQIWREQRSANETRRLGGEYPRATTVLCQCEIATITAAAGILAIESKCCAIGARLIALSGVVVAGALQQLN